MIDPSMREKPWSGIESLFYACWLDDLALEGIGEEADFSDTQEGRKYRWKLEQVRTGRNFLLEWDDGSRTWP